MSHIPGMRALALKYENEATKWLLSATTFYSRSILNTSYIQMIKHTIQIQIVYGDALKEVQILMVCIFS